MHSSTVYHCVLLECAPKATLLSHISTSFGVRLQQFLIDPKFLKIANEETIGEGNFGKIHLAQLNKGRLKITVAVKTLKGIGYYLLDLNW